MKTPGRIFVFGDCELDEVLLELRHAGRVLPLQPKPFQVLRYLIDQRARVVSKQELFDALWPGVCVGESSLWAALRDIRRVLRHCNLAEVISTRRGQGYRFLPAVTVRAEPAGATPDFRLPPPRHPAVQDEPAARPVGADSEGGVAAQVGERCSDARSALVGRAAQLEAFGLAWTGIRTGKGRIVLIDGEPGIGKSCFLESIAERARREGADVFTAQCLADCDVEPLGLFRELGERFPCEASRSA